MEDLFQILIILIFIISSIVSSMNKKKKMQKQRTKAAKPVSTSEKPAQVKVKEVKKEKSSAELLEEMFGMKINLPEPQEIEAPADYSEKNIEEPETWDPAKEYEEVEKKFKKIDYQSRVTAKKTELSSDSDKHRAFKEEIKPQQVFETLELPKLFSKQANLKDYIKVQEILNKPKALRR